jgi:hypothetical protein
MKTLRELFELHNGRWVGKVDHFFDDYEHILAPLRGRPIRLLEIGVNAGGSLELWQAYFGAAARVHGLDIDPAAIACCPPGAEAHLGSQDDVGLLRELSKAHGPFDLVIDDGSHMMRHQISSFEALYPLMTESGVYICEDAFTSYWPEYGGGPPGTGDTFIDYARTKVDELHAWWLDHPAARATAFTATTRSITFLSGAVVFQRGRRSRPLYVLQGAEGRREVDVASLHRAAREQLSGS